jgi:hypothetical protein
MIEFWRRNNSESENLEIRGGNEDIKITLSTFVLKV